MSRREPVSIVCVWNDEAVRAACLDAGVTALLPTAPRTEYLPVDNRGQVHTTAGSALNSGVRSATHDHVVLVHQDVRLHSLEALERAAGSLADHPDLGVLGAIGITADGELVGRVRDRVVLLGRSTATPVDVDSLDEVLFVARRDDLLQQPLSEHADLAWHAYAVELGMRARAGGRRVAAVDVPLTHNSLTTNLARLDHAHALLAGMYPEQVPTRTTCGDITSTVPRSQARPLLARHRWRLRWLRGSWTARRVKALVGEGTFVLSDIRVDVDRVLEHIAPAPLRVLNVRAGAAPFPEPAEGTSLRRGAFEVACSTVAPDALRSLDLHEQPTLVTNLGDAELRGLGIGRDDVVGIHESGAWLLTGVGAAVHDVWTDPRTRPAGVLV